MKRAAGWTWLCGFLFLLGCFGTPLHLALEAHDWHHHHEGEEDHPEPSDQETHSGGDHELTALAKAPRLSLPVVDIIVLHLGILPPDVRPWVPSIEPEAHSPPDVFASPPRSPRSPPV